ncbi:hypothetical protein ACWIVU_10855 [Ursidibacter arcticus]
MSILDAINKEKQTRHESSKLNYDNTEALKQAEKEKAIKLKKSEYKKNYTFSLSEGTIERLKTYCFNNKLKYNETLEVFINEALERRKI